MRPRNSRATEDIWDKFKSALLSQGEIRPEGDGWLTFQEMMKRLGMTKGKLRRVMANAPESFEKFDGMVLKDTKLVRCVWYRPVL
jgi:heme oxygenase